MTRVSSSAANRPTIGAHRAEKPEGASPRPKIDGPKAENRTGVPGQADRFEKARPGKTAFQAAGNMMTPGAIYAPPPSALPGAAAAAGGFPAPQAGGGSGGPLGFLNEIARFPPLQFLQGLTGVAGQLAGAPMATLAGGSGGGFQPLAGLPFPGSPAGQPAPGQALGSGQPVHSSFDQGSIGPRLAHHSEQGLAGGGVHRNTASAGVDANYQTHSQVRQGPLGTTAQAGVSGRAGPTVETRGSIEQGDTRIDYSGRAGVEARGQANAYAEAGPLGGRVGGDVGGELWAGVEGDARVTNQYGSGGVYGTAGARAYAHGDANAEVGPTGARARLGGEVGAVVEAEAGADFRSHGVPLGGEIYDVRGSVRGRAEAGVKAEGGIQADATIEPPRLGGEIGGTAFAGAKAEAEAKVGLGEFVSVTGRAGAWAGAGAEGKGILGFDDGKIRFGLSGGAAVGYGAGARGVVEVDVKKMANAAIGTGLQFASKAPTYATNPAELVFDVSKLAFGMASQGQQFAMGIGQVATQAPSMILQALGGLGGAPGGAAGAPAGGAAGASLPGVGYPGAPYPGMMGSMPSPTAVAGGGTDRAKTYADAGFRRGNAFEPDPAASRPDPAPASSSRKTSRP